MGLIVDTGIRYGNACDVSVSYGPEGATVEFAADPHCGPETLWFCFRLRHDQNAAAPVGRVQLILKHFQNMLGGSKPENVYPVARMAGDDWQRLPAGSPDLLPDGRCSAAWTLDIPAPHVDIAVCYPYGMSEVDALVRESNGFWQAHTIGVSPNARPLVRLSNGPGEAGSDRPGLCLMARQHSGETPGSWVLDGFLRHVATLGEKAPLVWCVPLTNIDGVEQGDYGKDNFPYDLNRAWGPVPMRHETLVFQRDIQRWRQRCRPVLAIDFHAPGLCEAEGSYVFLPSPRLYQGQNEQARQWADAMAGTLPKEYVATPFGRVATYASRWETPTLTTYACGLGICALSLETPYGAANGKVLTREEYRLIGQRLSQCVMQRLPGEKRAG